MLRLVHLSFLLSLIFVLNHDYVSSIENELTYFQKLTAKKGTWIASNKDFDGTEGYSHFMMKFSLDEFGSLEGKIVGIDKNKDTTAFWKITEFTSSVHNETVFIQRGPSGYGIGSATYLTAHERIGIFELIYSNGLKEKHRDTHFFKNAKTIQTTSELFNVEKQKWMEISRLTWKRVD